MRACERRTSAASDAPLDWRNAERAPKNPRVCCCRCRLARQQLRGQHHPQQQQRYWSWLPLHLRLRRVSPLLTQGWCCRLVWATSPNSDGPVVTHVSVYTMRLMHLRIVWHSALEGVGTAGPHADTQLHRRAATQLLITCDQLTAAVNSVC